MYGYYNYWPGNTGYWSGYSAPPPYYQSFNSRRRSYLPLPSVTASESLLIYEAQLPRHPVYTVPLHRRPSRFLRRNSLSFRASLKKSRRLRSTLRARPVVAPSRKFAEYRSDASFDSYNLAPRPTTWRKDYVSPHHANKLSYILWSAVDRKAVKGPIFNLHSLLQYISPNTSPIYYDIRQDPLESRIQFLDLPRPTNQLDLYQLATSPAVDELLLYHPRLPWHIHVHATHENGVTVEDVLAQIHHNLRIQVGRRDVFNAAMNPSDRDEIYTAYYLRNGAETGGVLRMDFLGIDVVFLGLGKGRNGLWEIKTSKVAL